MRLGKHSSSTRLRLAISLAVLISAVIGVGSASAMESVLNGALPKPFFPSDNWWNLDVSDWPVDPGSAQYIAFINNGSTRRLHPDLGGKAPTADQPFASYGMPCVVVTGVQPSDLVSLQFHYESESDGVDHASGSSYPFYPIPRQAITEPYWIEGGPPGNLDLRDAQDRHLIIVDSERNYLYELYNVFYDTRQGKWFAGSGAFFDMNGNGRRPETWTSADAAGLAILPGLIRYDEVYDPSGAEIRHAFRVTVRATNGYVYPASHRAGSRVGALPMGARLRLKRGVDPAQRTRDPNMQRIFRAMQRHGLIVADNGSDIYVTGTYDPRWNNDNVNPAFRSLTANDFEVLQLGHNPPVPRVPAPVSNLRARLQSNTVFLTWDPTPGTTRYRVLSAEKLALSTNWQSVAESSDTTWPVIIEASSLTRFYQAVSIE